MTRRRIRILISTRGRIDGTFSDSIGSCATIFHRSGQPRFDDAPQVVHMPADGLRCQLVGGRSGCAKNVRVNYL